MRRCRECKHVYVATAVPEEVLSRAYGQGYYDSGGQAGTDLAGYKDYLKDTDKRAAGFARRLENLERFLPSRGRLLDYGCAVGLFVKVAQDRGWSAEGYERSEWAAEYGRGTLGVRIHTGDVPEFDRGGIDLITLWDCIEHLPDPIGVLRQAISWLRPGGLLAINTVNSSSAGARLAGLSWRHVSPPLHLHLFSAKSLRLAAENNGFQVLSTQCEGVVFGAKGNSTKWPALAESADDVLCHWRMSPVTTALNLSDEIYMIAAKSRVG